MLYWKHIVFQFLCINPPLHLAKHVFVMKDIQMMHIENKMKWNIKQEDFGELITNFWMLYWEHITF